MDKRDMMFTVQKISHDKNTHKVLQLLITTYTVMQFVFCSFNNLCV